MIVADTNIIASLWVPNDMDELAYKLLETDPDWVAPIYWRSEFRSVTTNICELSCCHFQLLLKLLTKRKH
jgi:hypothetical protein